MLTRRLDQRRPATSTLRSHVDGNAPLPEMTQETRQSWQAFQKRSRTNWGKLVVDCVVDRVIPNGITVKGDPKNPLAVQAQRIWRDNRMDSVIKDWVRSGLTFGQSYLTAWAEGVGENPADVAITSDSPESMYVATNPLQQWRPEAALKTWRDLDAEEDYAMLWLKDRWVKFRRPAAITIERGVVSSTMLTNLAEGRWDRTGDEDRADGIPIVVFSNPGGVGEFEPHIDLINRINAGILERLVIMAMQAFRQRAITGGTLPDRDEDGNQIDYSRVFAPAPGALWNLPEGLELWESEQVNVEPLLAAAKDDVRQLSAVTRTPLPVLMPDNQNQSAEGAKATDSGFVFRCRDRISEAKLGAEAILVKALRLDGATVGDGDNVEVTFEFADRATLTEKYVAAKQAKDSGESWRGIQRNVLGRSPDQIAQDAIDQAQEALLTAAYTAPERPEPAQPVPAAEEPPAGQQNGVQPGQVAPADFGRRRVRQR